MFQTSLKKEGKISLEEESTSKCFW